MSKHEAPARVEIRVTPGARENAMLGWQDEILLVRVHARAQDGKANEAVRRLLADKLGLPLSALSIVRGANSRRKLVSVDGLDQTELRKRLALET